MSSDRELTSPIARPVSCRRGRSFTIELANDVLAGCEVHESLAPTRSDRSQSENPRPR